ncbi:MAG: cytochrome P460 family protein [Phycisphaeraceae bacterium]|nr:cytochrome P460 family protein [Phycisphaeraceae bacterium]
MHPAKRTALVMVAAATATVIVASFAGGPGLTGAGSDPNVEHQLPPGYRDWRLISVAREEGDLDDIRAVLGNDAAISAYREQTLPFPDGAVIARLAWACLPSEENNKVFGKPQSFVAGPPKNGIQFMVKDSARYASTGGWGYFQFDDGKPMTDQAKLQGCFDCHQAVKARDYVFTRYAR